MIRIEIGDRNYLLYLVLPHSLKSALLSPASREKLDRINRDFNTTIYSGEGAAAYDRIHRYGEEEQHEYPVRLLLDSAWGAEGYGRVLELGAGSGYFTALLARRAISVLAVEPVPDMAKTLRERCRSEGLENVRVVEASTLEIDEYVSPASIDSAFRIQSLHHFHRRPEVFKILGRAVHPGGSLFFIEPHHNLRRVARLLRAYRSTYRFREFWSKEHNWATHDFLTRREIRTLCRAGGFRVCRISGYWFPYSRRLVRDPVRRFGVETMVGRIPFVRHWASVLAVAAVREGA